MSDSFAPVTEFVSDLGSEFLNAVDAYVWDLKIKELDAAEKRNLGRWMNRIFDPANGPIKPMIQTDEYKSDFKPKIEHPTEDQWLEALANKMAASMNLNREFRRVNNDQERKEAEQIIGDFIKSSGYNLSVSAMKTLTLNWIIHVVHPLESSILYQVLNSHREDVVIERDAFIEAVSDILNTTLAEQIKLGSVLTPEEIAAIELSQTARTELQSQFALEIPKSENKREKKKPQLVVKHDSLLSFTISAFDSYIKINESATDVAESQQSNDYWKSVRKNFDRIKSWLFSPSSSTDSHAKYVLSKAYFDPEPIKDYENREEHDKNLCTAVEYPHMRYFFWDRNSNLTSQASHPPMSLLCVDRKAFRTEWPRQFYRYKYQWSLTRSVMTKMMETHVNADCDGSPFYSWSATAWLRWICRGCDFDNLLRDGHERYAQSYEDTKKLSVPRLEFFVREGFKKVDDICLELMEVLEERQVPKALWGKILYSTRKELEQYAPKSDSPTESNYSDYEI